MSILLVVILLLIGHSRAFPQAPSSRRNAIVFTWGFQDYRSQDFIFSPLIYQGDSFSVFAVSYVRETGKQMHRVDFSTNKLAIQSSEKFAYFEVGKLVRTSVSKAEIYDFRYGYGRAVAAVGKLKFYVGGVIGSTINFSDYRFGSVTNEGTVISYSLSPWLVGDLKIATGNAFRVETVLPFVTWVGRSTFSISDDKRLKASSGFLHVTKNGSLEFLSSYFNFNIVVSYKRSLFRNLDVLFSYSIDYLKHQKPLPVSILKNNFLIGLAYRF